MSDGNRVRNDVAFFILSFSFILPLHTLSSSFSVYLQKLQP